MGSATPPMLGAAWQPRCTNAPAATAAPPDGDAQRQAQPYSAADAYSQTHNEAREAVMPEERIGLRSGSTRMLP